MITIVTIVDIDANVTIQFPIVTSTINSSDTYSLKNGVGTKENISNTKK